ncbi:MAG: nucleoside deaminase [Actinomycetales bacterium]|nr:nucleoside deaminase [Actinomycetales bacterium]
MTIALARAQSVIAGPDVPIAALVIDPQGVIRGAGVNACVADADPTAHAEIIALREAGRTVGQWRLDGYTLLTTVEPCAMCAGAALNARVARIVYGAVEPRTGAVGSTCDVIRDRPGWAQDGGMEVVGGVCAEEAARLLRTWFRSRRSG